jgi:branched-subunit amino acid ABC-type transport system permease component
VDTFITTILLGIVSGSVYGLASTGIVLTFKTSGILNFGYGALALFTTFIHWELSVGRGVPGWLSALIVVFLVAPAIGILLDRLLFRRIEGQPMVIGVIATVGLFVLLQGIVFFIWKSQTRSVPSLFPSGTVGLPGGANIGIDQLGILGVAAAAAILLGVMFRFTRIGVAFRAVVDNRPVAGLMAINTGLVSGLAWAMSTAFAALVGILLTPQVLLDPNFLPAFIIIQVLGASIVGYLRSLPLAYVGGLILGVIQGLIIQYGEFTGVLRNLGSAVPFVMISVLLLFAPKAVRLAGLGQSFIVRTREVAEQASARLKAGTGLVLFGVLALVPLFVSPSYKSAMTIGLVHAIIFLSLVILTGYSGQISLGHTAFMGISAFTAAHLASNAGMSVWMAMGLGMLAAFPAGVLIGVIAVRLHGLFLALMTLAFAFMAQQLFFGEPSVSGPEGSIGLPRPPGFTRATPFYYLVLVALAVCALIAVNLRSGRAGRVLGAIRDSETATRALGISVVKYKIIIFSLSAVMAGLGGILFSMILERAGTLSFIPFFSLVFMAVAVLGGIFHVGGAIAAGLLFGLYPRVFGNIEIMGRLQLILFGLGATLALAENPEGMFGEMRRGANALLGALRRPRASGRDVAAAPIAGGER